MSELRKSTRKRTRDEVYNPLLEARQTWSKEDVTILTGHLKVHGFDGDMKVLQRLFPNFSESGVRCILNQLRRNVNFDENSKMKKNVKDMSNGVDEKGASAQDNRTVSRAPIEEWITKVVSLNETYRVGTNIPHVLEYIAKFEELPSPEVNGGVDYRAIYIYLASLLKGHIPKRINPPSAMKLLHIFGKLTEAIRETEVASKHFVEEEAKDPVHKVIQGEEKNQILRDRRRVDWSAEELEEKELATKSEDADVVIPNLYNRKFGLNPFRLPIP